MEDILIKLDELTTSIVMSFERVKPIEKALSSINEVGENLNEYVVEFDNNELRAKKKNNTFAVVVKVDTVNKKIHTEELGIRFDKNKDEVPKHFFTKKVYSSVDNRDTTYTYSRNYKIFNNKNNTKIEADISKNYNFYEDGRFMGSNYEKESRVVVKDNSNDTISDLSDFINTNVYVLATGDMLERNELNGNVSFYLVSSSKDKDNSFRKRLTAKEYEEIISLESDPYVVANNDIVYDTRKTNYS